MIHKILLLCLVAIAVTGKAPGQSANAVVLSNLQTRIERAIQDQCGVTLTNKVAKEVKLNRKGFAQDIDLNTVPASNDPTDIEDFASLTYKFWIDEKTLGHLYIMRFETPQLAEEHLDELIRRLSVSPRALPGVGDRALIGVNETNPELTGGLYFRRGSTVVQLSARRTAIAHKMAAALDSILRESPRP